MQQWDEARLSILVQTADAEITVLALAGASHAFVERVLASLPRPQAKALRYAIEHLSATPLSDLEAAQRELGAIADELQVSGELGDDALRRLSLAA